MTEIYRFTIIMAVYNVEFFLKEAVDSLIAQDIGFDKIQLILVDDGSTDSSGSICDDYAAQYTNNIICIHQKNAGVSSARNAAKPFIQGKYVSYLDSDDMLTADTLSQVWAFFSQHEQETDVVAIPIFYFEGRTGAHRLNDKFGLGSRVIDLQKEWDAVQLSMSSSFVRREAIEERFFNPELHYGEDTQILLDILLEKQMLGVVSEAKYMYRLRTRGEPSALQRSLNDPRHYLPKMKYLIEKTIEASISKYGEIPKFIQYALMYDIQWIVRKNKFPAGVLTEAEEKEYLNRLFAALPHFDNDVILAQKYLTPEQKYYLLREKEKKDPVVCRDAGEIELYYGQCCAGKLSDGVIDIDFIQLLSNECIIDGYVSLYPVCNLKITVFIECNGQYIPCEPRKEWRSSLIFGAPLMCLFGFRATVDLEERKKEYCIRMGVEAEGIRVYLPLRFGLFSPVCDTFKNGYYLQNGRKLIATKTELKILPCKKWERAKSEIAFLTELLFNRENHRRKAALLRIAFWLVRPWHSRAIWMISDRRTRAGDNGEAFFRFIRKNHPEIDARFILQKGSATYQDLAKIGNVIENGTVGEKLTALLSDCIISSQAEIPYLNPLFQSKDVFRDVMADKRFIFLQHGIIKDDLSGWLMKPNKNFSGFVTSTVPEYRSVLEGHYGYTEKEVWLTGLPRYDYLEDNPAPTLITVMPSWRRFLMQDQDTKSMGYPLVPNFTESDFYHFYNDLLNEKKLLEAASQYGYRLAFLPHPTLQPYLDVFHRNENVQFFGLETGYKEVYRKSAMVITDYSSAVFDAAYLYRPIVYAQFDKDVFFAGEHIYQKGYFDYERDGFGEVEYTYESTVERIIEYIKNGCHMKPVYRERVDHFFAYRDRNNCQRVYDKIMEERE